MHASPAPEVGARANHNGGAKRAYMPTPRSVFRSPTAVQRSWRKAPCLLCTAVVARGGATAGVLLKADASRAITGQHRLYFLLEP
eukprot:15199238-Alexandrium_andersonii.AAC.1